MHARSVSRRIDKPIIALPNVLWTGSLLVAILFSQTYSYGQLPEGFIREPLATGLNPTSMLVAPDGRIFVTEKHGVIRVIRDGQLLDEPFLTLEVDDSNERGLGHMALHPDFDQNGYYYIYYSVPGWHHNRISRFSANGDKTIPGSEMVILNLDPLASEMHNGGAMVFGIDGYLYVATGDGGQSWNAEDLGSTHGKVLRIDDAGFPVPDNPWFNLNYRRADHVYAYGLRNPYTMTLHPATGQLFANDVGFSKFEEVNEIEWGAFYGYPRLEGKRINQPVPAEYLDPVFQYAHTNHYCAIVGSVVYLPEIRQFPDTYHGLYFYSDYCTGHIRMLDVETWTDQGVFVNDGDRVIDMDISREGHMYYLERRGLGDGTAEDNTSSNNGVLWKISYTGSGAPFISVQPQSTLVSVGEMAVFSVAASGAMPLTYVWRINGVESGIAHGSALEWMDVKLEQNGTVIQVQVSNAFGSATSNEVLLSVTGNQRPWPEITSPPDGADYSAGEVIQFSGLARDAEEGILSADALSWRIDFHHGSHAHPALSWTSGMISGDWTIPNVGETAVDVWYRIYLKATDQHGLSRVIHRDIFPRLGKIMVNAQPEGLNIALDGAPRTTPYTFQGVRGISRYIIPPNKQVLGDSVYFFKQWSDGSMVINREIKAGSQDQVFSGKFQSMRNGTGKGLTVSYYDNIEFAGEPVATTIDSVIDHHFLFKGPYPGIPDDYFGIVWKGYIQPHSSGIYQFTVFADDAVSVAIDGQMIIQNWNPGVKNERGSIYLEGGRLYPIEVRLVDWLWNSQISLRWSNDDFPEEVIPTSQLYPADLLSEKEASGILKLELITAGQLRITTESYKETELDFSITSVQGHVLSFPRKINAGRFEMTLDISALPQGLYFFSGQDAKTGERITLPFMKPE